MGMDSHNAGHHAADNPLHEDVSFETRDVRVPSVHKFLAVLAVVLGISYVVCFGVYKWTTARIERVETPPPAIRQGVVAPKPPEPRLQGVPGHDSDPQKDLRNKLAADREELEKAGWIDLQKGTAQIPIEDAMKIVAEKGLPGATAPAEKKK